MYSSSSNNENHNSYANRLRLAIELSNRFNGRTTIPIPNKYSQPNKCDKTEKKKEQKKNVKMKIIFRLSSPEKCEKCSMCVNPVSINYFVIVWEIQWAQ